MSAIYRKYFRNATRYFLVYLFLPLAFFLTTAIVDVIYAAIFEISPNLLPSYDRVLEKEEYEAFVRTINAVSALLSVFLVSFATGVYDNARYEDVITRTDGLFKIKDEFPTYFKKVIISDIIAVALPGILFIPLTIPSYSKKFLDYLGGFLAPHFAIAEVFTPLGAYFMIFLVAILARIFAMPSALKRYRGLWLTSFVDS